MWLAVVLFAVGAVVYVVIARMPPSSSAFKAGWTREEYRQHFGSPIYDDVDKEKGDEIWGYETSGGYVFIFFHGNAATSSDVMPLTKDVRHLMGR